MSETFYHCRHPDGRPVTEATVSAHGIALMRRTGKLTDAHLVAIAGETTFRTVAAVFGASGGAPAAPPALIPATLAPGPKIVASPPVGVPEAKDESPSPARRQVALQPKPDASPRPDAVVALVDAVPASPGPAEPRKRGWKETLGVTGLGTSLLVHVVLGVLALIIPLAHYISPPKPDPSVFTTGAGGGAGGRQATEFAHRMKAPSLNPKKAPRLVAKTARSDVTLPSTPDARADPLSLGAISKGGAASSGSGGGLGGGAGSGVGIGRGAGNMAGRFVMGARVKAEKLAVYLDCSGSMTAYLPRVVAEIRKQFPDADVFAHDGIRILVLNNEVVGGRHDPTRATAKKTSGPPMPKGPTDPKALSLQGRRLFDTFHPAFDAGSVGAWIDVMRTGPYDALIVFSDFKDGIIQYGDTTTKVLYVDYGEGTEKGVRKPAQIRWEKDWVTSFTPRKGTKTPTLYLFTTEVVPQRVYQECVAACHGEIKDASWLQTGGEPPADDATAATTDAEPVTAFGKKTAP